MDLVQFGHHKDTTQLLSPRTKQVSSSQIGAGALFDYALMVSLFPNTKIFTTKVAVLLGRADISIAIVGHHLNENERFKNDPGLSGFFFF